MRLVLSPQAIAVVRLPAGAPDPTWATGGPLISITKTEHETSVICPTSAIPEEVPGPVQGPLVGVYVDEQLDFSQVGILVGLLKPLADAGIPVLTVSTYDTDWVLIEASRAAAASSVWRAAGYSVVDGAAQPDAGEDTAEEDEDQAEGETEEEEEDQAEEEHEEIVDVREAVEASRTGRTGGKGDR